MQAQPSPRGAPWALLAVLASIGVVTVGTCGLGGWLVARSVQSATHSAQLSQGPVEVRNEAYRVVMRRRGSQSHVELHEGALARNGLEDAILRRIEYSCEAQLRVRTVGADALVVPWMDFVANAPPSGEPTRVLVQGLDTEAFLRAYLTPDGEPFHLVGFVHGDILFTLDITSSWPLCVKQAIASIELLGGVMDVLPRTPVDEEAPTFRIQNNRFESFVSGLVIEAPAPFVFASTSEPSLWFEEDEAILFHPNGTEIHVMTSGLWAGEIESTCAQPDPEEGDQHITVRLDGTERSFFGESITPRWSLRGVFCSGLTLVDVIAMGPNASRTEEALRALENRLQLRERELHDDGGHQRSGGEDWSLRNDAYEHVPSRVHWRRPAHTEVRTLPLAHLRPGYPDQNILLEFQRRDVRVYGALWAHTTELTAGLYHEAFVAAGEAQGAAGSGERVDSPWVLGTCTGTRSDLSYEDRRTIAATCVHEGQAIAFEARVVRTELPGALEYANEAFHELVVGEFSETSTFQVDGASVERDGACAVASTQQGGLRLEVTSCASWTPSLALSAATFAAQQGESFRVGLNRVQRSRVFAAETPASQVEISGFPGEERRVVIGNHALRVTTVMVDSTAYVLSCWGPNSTPESAWSELLATVHIDP